MSTRIQRLAARVNRWLAAVSAAACVAGCRAAGPDPRQAPGEGAASASARVDTTVAGGVRVVVADTVLTLSAGAAGSRTSLAGYIDGAGGYEHTLLDARRGSGGRFYLLIHTFGLSRPGTPGGYCGAGEERNLIWIAADSTLRVRDVQSVLFHSCLASREWHSEAGDLADQPLVLRFHDARDEKVTTARYDRGAPELGIRVASVPDTAAAR